MIRIGIMALLLLALAGCGGGPQSALDPQGSSAFELKQLIILIVGVCSVVWALVMIALIWALMRSRGDAAPRRTAPRRMTIGIAAATGATAIIIMGFTLASFYTTRALSHSQSDLTITVHGKQWWWDIMYGDDTAPDHFRTANEIRIPVGKVVRLRLQSDDVIHSFWVPSLAGKLDLIPGRTNELTLRADRAGTYRGQCAEFCGLQHTHMAMVVIALDDAAFEQWRATQRSAAQAPTEDEVRAGAAVFLSKPCAACHTVRGTPATGTTGPDLTHVADRTTIAAGLLDTTRGSLAAWIADPQTLKPGNNMPMVPLTADELQSLSAYMASLK